MEVFSLKIGIDCIAINPDYAGGINSFTFSLLDGFKKNPMPHKFVLFVSKENKHLFENYGSPNFRTIEVKAPPLLLAKLEWQSIKLGSKIIYHFLKNNFYRKQMKLIDTNCDVLYTPTTVLYSFNSKVPTVLSMHDIQHTHFIEFFTRKQLRFRHLAYELSARYADYLQASSQYIKDDFLRYFKFLRPENVEVINECVNQSIFKKEVKVDVLTKYRIPGNFLFYPAQLWPHKNHITLLKAIRILQEKGIIIPVVLTGIAFSAKDQIVDYIRRQRLNHVYYLGKTPFEDIIELYKKARFLITASMHESSSLPILEAAAAGIPIVASDIPPNIEMGKILQLNLFETTNAVNLARIIKNIWNDEKLIRSQVEHNLRNVEAYACENIAKKYIDLFEQIVNKQNLS